MIDLSAHLSRSRQTERRPHVGPLVRVLPRNANKNYVQTRMPCLDVRSDLFLVLPHADLNSQSGLSRRHTLKFCKI